MSDDRVKRPAYQWYVMDARGDEVFMLMSYEQQGIYRALLDHQWIEGSLPADPKQLATILKVTPGRFAKVWPLISAKFLKNSDGRLINDRLENQRHLLDQYLEEKRKRGQNGGRRRADRLAAASLALHAKPKREPSSSSSSSLVQTATEQQSGADRTGASQRGVIPSVPTEKAPNPAKEFLTWFQSEYKARRHGATYFVSWEKHMPIVGRLLKLHDPQRLRKHAQYLLTTNEPWTETTDRGIEVLASKINWLEEKLCAWEAKRKAREAV